MCAMLRSTGATVEAVDSAEAASELVTTFAPHVVVVDVVLPGASGFSLVASLKSNPSTQGIVCIAVSAVNGPEIAKTARTLGCAAYVRKPIDTTTFPELIASQLPEKRPE